jgi:hypothetical protein
VDLVFRWEVVREEIQGRCRKFLQPLLKALVAFAMLEWRCVSHGGTSREDDATRSFKVSFGITEEVKERML